MINALVLYELHQNEIECTLSAALESPFMKDPLYLWIASGQYLQNQTDFLKADALTYVAPSFNEKGRYSVCTILNGKSIKIQKDFTKKELYDFFPKLFNLKGQLISL